MLVREVLSGVGDALALDPGDLIDIHTAVTEACNNVVQHAYRGEEGPLDVVVELGRDAVTVVVRDWGVGISGPHGSTARDAGLGIGLTAPDTSHETSPTALDTGLGIGLAAIHALTHRLGVRRPADGGTEVAMEFATLGSRPPLPLGWPDFALPAIASTLHAPTLALTVTPGALARTVLPRLMCGLAARAHFSTDRLSDVHLVGDAIGTSDGAYLQIAAGIELRALELRIGPLDRGRGQRLVAGSTLDGLGSVIAKLANRCRVESAGPYEVLALQLTDDRGPAGPDRAKFGR